MGTFNIYINKFFSAVYKVPATKGLRILVDLRHVVGLPPLFLFFAKICVIFWYRCYYPYSSRDSMYAICGIFFWLYILDLKKLYLIVYSVEKNKFQRVGTCCESNIEPLEYSMAPLSTPALYIAHTGIISKTMQSSGNSEAINT